MQGVLITVGEGEEGWGRILKKKKAFILDLRVALNMVKPLYSRHHLFFINVLPKLVHFASETCSRVLWYNEFEPKVSQEADIWRRKNLKTIY